MPLQKRFENAIVGLKDHSAQNTKPQEHLFNLPVVFMHIIEPKVNCVFRLLQAASIMM